AVTTTAVGTSTAPIQRWESKAPRAEPACRMVPGSPVPNCSAAHTSRGAPSRRRRSTAPDRRRRTTGGVALAARPSPNMLEKKSRSAGLVDAKLRAVAHSTSPSTSRRWRPGARAPPGRRGGRGPGGPRCGPAAAAARAGPAAEAPLPRGGPGSGAHLEDVDPKLPAGGLVLHRVARLAADEGLAQGRA